MRYVHTNLIAEDWQRLADFYRTVFGCVDVPPERDFRGADLRLANFGGAYLQGAMMPPPENHLRRSSLMPPPGWSAEKQAGQQAGKEQEGDNGQDKSNGKDHGMYI